MSWDNDWDLQESFSHLAATIPEECTDAFLNCVHSWLSLFHKNIVLHEIAFAWKHGIWGDLNLCSVVVVTQICLQHKWSHIVFLRTELCIRIDIIHQKIQDAQILSVTLQIGSTGGHRRIKFGPDNFKPRRIGFCVYTTVYFCQGWFFCKTLIYRSQHTWKYYGPLNDFPRECSTFNGIYKTLISLLLN